MRRYKHWISIAAVVLLALGVNLDQFGIDLNSLTNLPSQSQPQAGSQQGSANTNAQVVAANSVSSDKHWSDTSPEINLLHVFAGEINRKGKPTGYHSRPNGVDPASARIVRIKDKPNRAGVYTATIEVRDGGKWKEKFSSFFPDSMSREQVVAAILHAYNNSSNPNKQPWSGPSDLGFQIQGYTTNRGGINTAFPIYRKNQ